LLSGSFSGFLGDSPTAALSATSVTYAMPVAQTFADLVLNTSATLAVGDSVGVVLFRNGSPVATVTLTSATVLPLLVPGPFVYAARDTYDVNASGNVISPRILSIGLG
jgi:hypothetical protein